MNCIDCRYNLLKDGHSKCTYEEGECIKINVLEKENAELKEDLRNKKLAIQNRNGRIKELEEKISVLLSCKNCTENKGGLICQKEYEDKCLTQKIQFIKELQEEIAKLENRCANYEMRISQMEKGSCDACKETEKNKRLEEFEKENAELKETFTKMNNVITKTFSNLTKSKEIIRELLNSCFGYNSKTVNYEVKVKAEQFLKDVSE